MAAAVARVAVEVEPYHLDRPFDYRVPQGVTVRVGHRVRVRFHGRPCTGWVLETADEASYPGRLLPLRVLDGPWLDPADLEVCRWVARRYGGTLAAVLRHVVPARVAAVAARVERWRPPPAPEPAARPPCASPAWRPYTASQLLRATADADGSGAWWLAPLPGEDRTALVVDLVARTLAGGRAALVLVADPRDRTAEALRASAGGEEVADLRGSGRVGAGARYEAAARCRLGKARVAVGGPGAALAPVRDLGLVVVVDEAASAHKLRLAPYPHARTVALARARMLGAVTVLVGDVPSSATWAHLRDGHLAAVTADRATVRARRPRVDVVDLAHPRPGQRRARFALPAARAMRTVLDAGGIAVVLAARRGDGAALGCSACGRRRCCPVCDGALAAVVVDASAADDGNDADAQGTWTCTSCGWKGSAFPCSSCGAETTAPLRAGAQRFAGELGRSYPEVAVARMEGYDAPGPSARPAVAVMTRGSVRDRPEWLAGSRPGVVVVPDADALLGRPGYGAAEDALRLWMAAARDAAHVIVQTREPGHHAVQALVRWDADGFWQEEAARRAELGWPPHATLVQIRLTGADPALVKEVAATVEAGVHEADVLGPDLDGAMLVKTRDLRGTLDALAAPRREWGRRDVGVRVDVDPSES